MFYRNRKILVPVTKCLLLLFLISCNSFTGPVGVTAVETRKTHILTAESSEPLVLDCNYDVEQNNSTLVVKWLKDDKPIYHWIKGHMPTVYPQSKGLIDEKFVISPNANYRYRAIVFPEPTKELTGNYKCLVESMNSTQLIQINLQVIDVSESNILVHYITLPNDTIVTCDVENVYPEPKLLLWSKDDITLSKISEKVGPEINGFYNATVSVSADAIDSNDEISCTVSFPDVEFNMTKILKSSTSTKQTTVIGIVFMLLVVISA